MVLSLGCQHDLIDSPRKLVKHTSGVSAGVLSGRLDHGAVPGELVGEGKNAFLGAESLNGHSLLMP